MFLIRSVILVAAWVFAAVPPVSAQIDFLDPPQGTFSDDWMIVELNGSKTGYSHSTMSREGDKITTRMLTLFRIGRVDEAVEISLLQSTTETVSGTPLTFELVTKAAVVELATRGRIENGKVSLTTSQFGRDTNTTADFPAGSCMTWGAFRAGIEHGFEPGTKYDLELYEPSLNAHGSVTIKTVVGEKMEIELLGRTHSVTKVTSTLQLPIGGYDTIGYVDDAGKLLRAEMQLAGFPIMMTVVDKATALGEFEAPEFFTETLIKVDRHIDRAAADRIDYTLTVEGEGRKIPALPTTAMQVPGDRSERKAALRVSRLNADALRDIQENTTPSQPREYLASSPMLNIEDDAIVKMAREAAKGETRPYLLADRLRVYVSDVIKDKGLDVGFATASEVCRRRQGDCSEHAVLLAALGRAQGLPSRVVVGLAYLPSFAGATNVFGFHMWTQFYIGDQWVDFDAALNESDCSPARIALATSPLQNTGLGDIAFAVLDVINGLRIHIDAVESR